MADDHDFSAITTPFSTTAAAAAFGYYTLDQPADSSTTAHFESAFSSLVSSPTNAAPAPCYATADIAIGDLIGRLGSICNGSTLNASCYSTPLSSPRHAVLPLPGLPACRARGSGLPETGKLSRVSSSKSMALESGNAAQHETEVMAMSSPQAKAAGGGGARKRKAQAKGKAKSFSPMIIDTESDLGVKRPKLGTAGGDAGTGVTENNSGGNAEQKEEMSDDDAKAAAPEPPKDYIHVRARRGQATDSHSLAERVRRERISERMKMLQSLVPGCDKVTGKAVMLDEIINYVRSLQHQVEFLSMKVATMNPQLDYNGHCLYSKDMHQTTLVPAYQAEDMATVGFSYHSADLEVNSHINSNGAFWEQVLHSVEEMGIGQSQETALSSQNFYDQTQVNHTKVEP